MVRNAFRSPLLHIAVLITAVLTSFFATTIHPMDDHFNYQRFIESLAQGNVDFSIPGFQGSSFLAAPLHVLLQSPLTHIYFQILCAILLIPVSYWAIKKLLNDRFMAIVFMYILALSPMLYFIAFRGFTGASYHLMILLGIGLLGITSAWSWLPYGISMIIKPFPVALAPLFLLWRKQKKKQSFLTKGWVQLGLALIIPLAYVLAEYAQIGRILVGSHTELNAASAFVWTRVPFNLAHGIQMLFSVHNFYFPDPSLTQQTNMVHTSPILMMLGMLSLLTPQLCWKDKRLARALGFSFVLAFIFPALLDHMDHFYMEVSVIILVIASLPVIKKFPILLPLILATLHFQWLYFFLGYQEAFQLQSIFFIVPLVADIMFILFCFLERKEAARIVRPLLVH